MTILHFLFALLTYNEQADIHRLANRDYHTRSQAMRRLADGDFRVYIALLNSKHVNAEQQWRMAELEARHEFCFRKAMFTALLSGKLPGCTDLTLCEWFTSDADRFQYLGQRIDMTRCRWIPGSCSRSWIQAIPYMHGSVAADALEMIHQCRNYKP